MVEVSGRSRSNEGLHNPGLVLRVTGQAIEIRFKHEILALSANDPERPIVLYL